MFDILIKILKYFQTLAQLCFETFIFRKILLRDVDYYKDYIYNIVRIRLIIRGYNEL